MNFSNIRRIAVGGAIAAFLLSVSAIAGPVATKVTMKKFRLGVDDLGRVTASFTIANENTFAVKDIEVSCEYSGNSGTRLGTHKKTIYDVIEPGKTRTFNMTMGYPFEQTKRAGCDVAKAYTH